MTYGNYYLLSRVAAGDVVPMPEYIPSALVADGLAVRVDGNLGLTSAGTAALRKKSPPYPALTGLRLAVCPKCGFESPISLCTGEQK